MRKWTVVFTFALLSLSGQAQEPAKEPTKEPAEGAAKEPIVITGGSAAAHAWIGDAVPFWVHLQNNGTERLSRVSAQLLGGSAQLGALCWQSGPSAQCSDTPADVMPGGSLLLSSTIKWDAAGEWRPQVLVLRQKLAAVAPTVSDPKVPVAASAVSLGSVTVESKRWSWAQWVVGAIGSIAMPLAVVALGALFSNRQKERETREQARLTREADDRLRQEHQLAENRAAAEKLEAENRLMQERHLAETRAEAEKIEAERRLKQERELAAARAASEAERDERAETWRLMLPKSHRYATRYYAALSGIADSLCESVKICREALEEPGEVAPRLGRVRYHIVMFYRVHRAFTNEVGGWYLKSRVAEELIVLTLDGIEASIFNGHMYEDASDAVTMILNNLEDGPSVMPPANFAKVLKEIEAKNPAEVDCLTFRLRDWMAQEGCDEGIAYFLLFARVLDYEMNRVYVNWYGEGQQLELDEREQKAVNRILAANPKKAGLIEKYLAETTGRARAQN